MTAFFSKAFLCIYLCHYLLFFFSTSWTKVIQVLFWFYMNSTGYTSDKLHTNRSYTDVWEFSFVRLTGTRQLHAGCRLSSINCAIVLPVDYSDYQWQNTFLWICGIKPERLNHLSSVAGQQHRKKNYALQLDLKTKKKKKATVHSVVLPLRNWCLDIYSNLFLILYFIQNMIIFGFDSD